jgi:hypothetical protein
MIALLPGTIANGFRLKHAVNNGGGVDETQLDIRHNWEKLLLKPEDGKHPLQMVADDSDLYDNAPSIAKHLPIPTYSISTVLTDPIATGSA